MSTASIPKPPDVEIKTPGKKPPKKALVAVSVSQPGLRPRNGRTRFRVAVTYTETVTEYVDIEADNEREAEDRALDQFAFVTGEINEVTITPAPLELEDEP